MEYLCNVRACTWKAENHYSKLDWNVLMCINYIHDFEIDDMVRKNTVSMRRPSLKVINKKNKQRRMKKNILNQAKKLRLIPVNSKRKFNARQLAKLELEIETIYRLRHEKDMYGNCPSGCEPSSDCYGCSM